MSVWRRLRRIFAMLRAHRLRVAAAVAAVLATAAVGLLFPLGIRALVDAALAGGRADLLHLLALGLLTLFVLRSGLAWAGSYLLETTGERLVMDLRSQLFRHLHGLDLQFFARQRIGDLVSRLSGDAAAIRNAVTETAVSLLNQLFQLAGAALVMLVLNWRLALIVLAVAPAATLVTRAFAPRLRRLAHQVQVETGNSVALAQESLSGVHVVQAFARSAREAERYDDSLAALFARIRRAIASNALFRAIVGLVTAAASVAIFWYGGLELVSGRLSAGDLVAFLFYSQTVATSLGVLAGLWTDLSFAVGASDRVFELLDVRSSVVEAPGAVAPARVLGEVRFEGVRFAYDGAGTVLDGVSFVARPGETVALVGLSGAGKTTLLHLLLRFFDPAGGRILLDGRDLRGLPLAWLREQVALVSQDVFLFAGSIGENIRFGRPEAGNEEVAAAARAAHADRFIDALPAGYDTEVGERGVKLSGGERQRLALARAFLKDAPILVLDEATSAVDAEAERGIRQALERLSDRRTTIVVAHRLSTVRAADRVVVLDRGGVREQGTPDDLLARPGGLYRRLVADQMLAAAAAPAVDPQATRVRT